MSKSPLGSAAPQEVHRSTTGSGWFVWMTGLWVVFFVLMHNGQLADLAAWIRGLPILLEILVWLVFFPQVLATAVWTSGWSEGLRVTLVVLFAAGWTLVSLPRHKDRR